MKTFFALSMAVFGAQLALAEGTGTGKPAEMTVYRSPSCGCCGKWIDHMQKNGFVIKDIKTEDMDSVKRKLGVPKQLESCHTALIGGMAVEGHVPAEDVKLALSEENRKAGLAAPGMPMGSPGMEMGGKKDAFAVIAFDKDGAPSRFSEH
jgi:hypothetical protein